MNRVYVGPLIERAEADKLKDVINRQQKLNGFVTRFQPEKAEAAAASQRLGAGLKT